MHTIDAETLRSAFAATLKKRGSSAIVADADLIIGEVEADSGLLALWSSYQRRFDYAADISWDMAIGAVKRLSKMAI
jgi:hypothetical protein